MELIKKVFKSQKYQNIKIFLSYLRNYNHSPYSLSSLFCDQGSLSDFFVFDRDCNYIGFIAENIRSILTGEEVSIKHIFKFFSSNGNLIYSQSFNTKEYFKKIVFKPIKTNEKYFSFIHYVESDLNLNEIFMKKGINKKIKFSEQNRGYSIYYPDKLSSGSCVHGNFGGISKDLKKMARTTFMKHIYTPIYKFEDFHKYDLVFNNPTNKNILIKILFNNSFKESILSIPSLGTRYLRIDNYCGSLSFESNLPICRPIVFKNPTPNFSSDFDVFHS